MRSADLVTRRQYALRIKGHDEPFAKVTYIGPNRGRQCKVRYEDGELAGLEEWVATRDLTCRWSERQAVLKDEAKAVRLREANEIADPVTEEAICTVMTASGEYSGYLREWDTDPASAQRYWQRAGLSGSPLDDHNANYSDRHGRWHLSFETALKAAGAFAGAEPESVDLYIRGWETELKAKGFEPGGRHSHELLRQWSPHFALARAWTQQPRGVAAEQEVERLRRLVHDAVRWLRAAGEEDKAKRIERGMTGR